MASVTVTYPMYRTTPGFGDYQAFKTAPDAEGYVNHPGSDIGLYRGVDPGKNPVRPRFNPETGKNEYRYIDERSYGQTGVDSVVEIAKALYEYLANAVGIETKSARYQRETKEAQERDKPSRAKRVKTLPSSTGWEL